MLAAGGRSSQCTSSVVRLAYRSASASSLPLNLSSLIIDGLPVVCAFNLRSSSHPSFLTHRSNHSETTFLPSVSIPNQFSQLVLSLSICNFFKCPQSLPLPYRIPDIPDLTTLFPRKQKLFRASPFSLQHDFLYHVQYTRLFMHTVLYAILSPLLLVVERIGSNEL